MQNTRAAEQGKSVRAFQGFESQAARRLAILNAAPSLDILRSLPSNRLEALRGDRSGHYSIRINRQWRLCFEWPDVSGEIGARDSDDWPHFHPAADVLGKRLGRYGLTLHETKTRYGDFRQWCPYGRRQMASVTTFDFLGFALDFLAS